jgi:hypothetical protein
MDGQPQVRISADVATREKGEFLSLNDNEILIFAVFHTECVIATMDDEECDDTPYVWEARSLMELADLCDECRAKMPTDPPETPPEDKKKQRHLSLIPGGRT